MPATRIPFFPGASNTQRSRLADSSQAINRFLEIPGPSAKAPVADYLRPVVRYYASATGPIRASFSIDDRAFVVGGAYFYEVNPNRSLTLRGGPMVLNGQPATITANALGEILITSGGEGYSYILATNVFANITSPTFPNHAVSAVFMKSFSLILSQADGKVYLSGINDVTTWSSLDFIKIADYADKPIQIAAVNDNVIIMGSHHSQMWWANGNASLPFAPIDAGKMEHGIDAIFTAVVTDNHLMMTGRNTDGTKIVWLVEGVTPKIISTPAVSASLASVTTYPQALAGSFSMQGHVFYVLYVPGLDLSWVYDLSSGTWVQWGHWVPELGRWVPFVGWTFFECWGKNFCGDRQSGAIYELSMSESDDSVVLV